MQKAAIIILLCSSGFAAQSQEAGVRWGDAIGGQVSIDGVFNLGIGRIHADVSFGDGVGLEALWDFLYKPFPGESFNWYVGAGPSFYLANPFLMAISAEIGLEYQFSGVPLSLSGDWRPRFKVVDDTEFHAEGFGLNLRYVFGTGKNQ